MKYQVISDYCGTLLDNNLYTYEAAKAIAEKETLEAKRLGFPEVTYSIIQI